MKHTLLFLSLSFFLVAALATKSGDCSLASKTLKKYIELDTAGETAHTSKQVDNLVHYNGQDTAAYDSVVVTSDSKLGACVRTNSGVEINVVYKVFGKLAGTASPKELAAVLNSAPRETEESFRLIKIDKIWKIDSSSIHQPHVGISAAKTLFARG